MIPPDNISHLYAILERANQIAANTELDDLLDAMLELIITVCGGNAGTLYLHDEITDELIFKVVQGKGTSTNLVGQRISTRKGIAGTAFREGKAIIVEALQRDKRWFSGIGNAQEQQTLRNNLSCG